MYLASVERPSAPAAGRAAKIAANVLALGAVSLITDVSSEMVTAILPLYLVAGLGLGPVVYGTIDGLYTGATALLRLVGGYVADRVQRRKLIAGLGYGISAVAKAGMLAAGAAIPWISAAIVADRAGKGLRTAPRDALITLSSPPDQLGRAFGVHRAMDSVGAFGGPLVAIGVLAASAQSYDAVFVVSGCIAAIGVLVLVLLVRDHRLDLPAKAVNLRQAFDLLRLAPIRLMVIGAALLGLSTIGDGFVYLLLQRRDDLPARWFPLLAVGTSLSYLIFAVPVGALADKIGRARIFIFGYAALLAVYILLALSWGGPPAILTILVLYGLFYAATDGVLMALAGPQLPAALKTTGLALIQTGQALAYLVSSVLFGLAWSRWDAPGAIRLATAAAVLTLGGSAILLLRTGKKS